MENYREKVAKLAEIVSGIKSPEAKVGTIVWTPCTGDGEDKEKGHAGKISIKGKKGWDETDEWLKLDDAKKTYGEGLLVDNSHDTCPPCARIIDSD